MQRDYVRLGQRQIHVRLIGRGAPIVVLHAPRRSSASCVPLAQALATEGAVLLPDLAGHGASDPLAADHPSREAFAHDVAECLEAVGATDCTLVAEEDAVTLASDVARHSSLNARAIVALDAPEPANGSEASLTDVFAAEPSGAHLVRAWDTVRSRYLFRPHFRQTLATRRAIDMPSPDWLTRDVVDHVEAGAHGARLAAECSAQSSPQRRDDDRPGIYAVQSTSADRTDATDRICTVLRQVDRGTRELDRLPSRSAAPAGRLARSFIRVRGGYIHARMNLDAPGRPLVALHDPAGTSALVEPIVAPFVQRRPVIALDLPGNGESDALLETDRPSSADYAAVVAETLDAVGIDEFDLIGRYSGAPIGMELAFRFPSRVRHLVAAGITTYPVEEATRLLERYTPSIAPREDGSHLVLAWHIMKSQALFWPWFDQTVAGIIRGEPQLDPLLIERRVLDLMRCGDRYRGAYAALWTYPLQQRLKELRVPTLLCAPPWDPLFDHLHRAAEAGPQCAVTTLPSAFTAWAAYIEPFLEDR